MFGEHARPGCDQARKQTMQTCQMGSLWASPTTCQFQTAAEKSNASSVNPGQGQSQDTGSHSAGGPRFYVRSKWHPQNILIIRLRPRYPSDRMGFCQVWHPGTPASLTQPSQRLFTCRHSSAPHQRIFVQPLRHL